MASPCVIFDDSFTNELSKFDLLALPSSLFAIQQALNQALHIC
jgi:hypothetical protein